MFPVIYSLSDIESGSTHVRNRVYPCKIENRSYQELVSHAIPDHIDELSSLVRLKQQQTILTAA